VHPKLEDPSGGGSCDWAGPEHIVEVRDVGGPILHVFLPEQLEHTP
jgi:hypothetical protein